MNIENLVRRDLKASHMKKVIEADRKCAIKTNSKAIRKIM